MYRGFDKSSYSLGNNLIASHKTKVCVCDYVCMCAAVQYDAYALDAHGGHSKYSKSLGNGSAVRKRDIWMRLQWVFSHIQLKGQAMIGSPWTRNCN